MAEATRLEPLGTYYPYDGALPCVVVADPVTASLRAREAYMTPEQRELFAIDETVTLHRPRQLAGEEPDRHEALSTQFEEGADMKVADTRIYIVFHKSAPFVRGRMPTTRAVREYWHRTPEAALGSRLGLLGFGDHADYVVVGGDVDDRADAQGAHGVRMDWTDIHEATDVAEMREALRG